MTNMKATFLAVAVLAVLMAIFVVYASGRENTRQLLVNPPTPTLGPHDRYVRYEVHGQAYSHITMPLPDGSSVQLFEHLPYSLEFPAPSGQPVSFSAQDDGFGEITCQIYVSGTKIKETTSTGKFSTATCSATVP